MEVLILTIFVSALLVAGELLFFAWNLKQRSHDHAEHLSLLPLEHERWTHHTSAAPHTEKES